MESLIKQRGNIKGKLTRFSSFLDKYEPETATIATMNELIKRKEKISEEFDRFEEIQAKILEIDSSEDNDETQQVEDHYFQLQGRAEALLNPQQPVVQPSKTSYSTTGTNNVRTSIKLPEITLPSFKGAYDEWLGFRDIFKSLIHNNESLSESQKFHYLRGSLQDSALQVIHSIETSEENYAVAWELLNKRFENKKIIIQNHIKSLIEAPALVKENHTQLRQFIDNMHRNLRALKSLGLPIDTWDALIIYLTTNKLDSNSRREWELKSARTENISTFKEFDEFLEQRCMFLESLDKGGSSNSSTSQTTKFTTNPKIRQSFSVTTNKGCPICKSPHFIYQCTQFKNLPVQQRIHEVKANNLCVNCLRPSNHRVNECKFGSCKICSKNHNSLLHLPKSDANNATQTQTSNQSDAQPPTTTTVSCSHANTYTQILLSTAMINVIDNQGNEVKCRALLDSGAQSHFIAQHLVNKLGLKSTNANIPITGICGSINHAQKTIKIHLKSIVSGFSTNLSCIVLDKLTDHLPQITFNRESLNIPNNICLADPDFNVAKNIDLIIGSDLFWELLCIGQIKPKGTNQPYYQKTQLGWIVAGRIQAQPISHQQRTSCSLAINNSAFELSRFWEQEECLNKKMFTQEERECEEHFMATHKRNEAGKFIVKLPIKDNQRNTLGDSKKIAESRFYSIERKQAHKREYIEFMQQYKELNHMREIEESDATISDEPVYYLPHHAVTKEDSPTTKLRVVFDGSAKSCTGISLNDILMVGPTIQDDLLSLVLRFRSHQFVMTADIIKMYRQILVDRDDQRLQRIFWREDPDQQLGVYELLTVTYGTASAPYLAVRCLQQLAKEEKDAYPQGSRVIMNDFYVDDMLTGAQTIEELIHIRNEVITVLQKGGFELSKWASNVPEIINEESVKNKTIHLCKEFDKSNNTKTLGLKWNYNLDYFQYNLINTNQLKKQITKRSILSCIAQIYDPLGLVGPVIITAKIILQQLWILQIDWDESLPLEIHTKWNEYKSQLHLLNNIIIPRKIIPHESPTEIQLHGFSDSSEAAFGACLYIRASYSSPNHTSELLCAKSRVAPIKKTTLPRLELNGAVLLARLVHKVVKSLNLQIHKIFLWTDSTIVLAWIRSPSSSWKTYVANRVSEIQEFTNVSDWNHISTHENPADCLSRGVTPVKLQSDHLWWHGPAWLVENSNIWPITNANNMELDIPERRLNGIVVNTALTNDELFEKFSSFTRLIKTVAIIKRFKWNAQNKTKRVFGPVTSKEFEQSILCLIKIIQSSAFSQELQDLEQTNQVNVKSKLLCLSPFIDGDGLMRVGGRLKHSNLRYDQKHQFILPSIHPFTQLLIRHTHEKQLHAGIQGTMAAIRDRFWPLTLRRTTQKILKNCVACFKVKPTETHQKMGNLPEYRIQSCRPFLKTGIDYCGPFQIIEGKRRNQKFTKAYGAIFVCLATKAVHIEVVSSLTTEAFISALKGFIARRGKVQQIVSDNATNFVGANRELKELFTLFATETHQQACVNAFVTDQIEWHFIPPRAPHFGGLWEATVKSAKHHLLRVTGNTKLTFEELQTLLNQIEAVLNSRPITPISNDSNDLTFLTPGHFIIGDSLTAIPEPSLEHLPINRLSYWQRIEQMKQSFWRRWHKEYLHLFQQRVKWRSEVQNQIKVGTVVLLKEDNLPPYRWPIGRITALHPGVDNITRVVSVKVASGEVKRAITKVCVFPIDI